PGGGFYKTDITDTSGMVLNGNAVVVDGVLRLANATQQISSGTAFFSALVPFDAGTSIFAHFSVRIGGGQGLTGGDGMAFVLQSSPAGARALGESGEGLAYKGLLPSVAVELDTFHNDTDPIGQHVALLTGGDTTRHLAYATVPSSLND